MNFKDIHIGSLINQAVTESGIEMSRICNFLKSTEEEVEEMYLQKDLPTNVLLRWSKLLKYDFFRIYSQHLILYAPSIPVQTKKRKSAVASKSDVPNFKKNVYTKEIIDYLLGLIESKEKTTGQIIKEYRIPKTTLYRWIYKYNKKQK